ncbi:MAG: hypothetical protein HC929_10930 [Leptolyngbyaceae cyanobacterium SM2_5_2]|nr:hypothetical protein [Leptolyngbyaceae cyanobacterium SM2_5_2]
MRKANRQQEHILVLPEDRANEEIINGFINNLNINANIIEVGRPSGGWKKVLDIFVKAHIPELRKHPKRIMILVIDFDLAQNRLEYIGNKIPEDFKNQVFILSSFSNPEKLRTEVKKSFEDIGKTLAQDCFDHTETLCSHELLQHNQNELIRIAPLVRPFLFDSNY